MPDIKKYSTGRLGNKWPEHPNSDHVNTKGLDREGTPGLEAYIDEDIVRAYDDNRPILNLLTNDEILNKYINEHAKSYGINTIFKNSKTDWDVRIGDRGYYVDPENFNRQIITTPLNIRISSAINEGSGAIAGSFKELVGFKRSDGTSLWIDPHEWYYDNTPTVDDPYESYRGYYKPIYSDVSDSSVPEDYKDYELALRQIYTTGAIYKYPIYTDRDVVIPLKSSIFNITDEVIDFSKDSVKYPGYDYYPESFVTLKSQNLGTLEVGKDTLLKRYHRKEEYKITANNFNAEAGAFKALLKSDVFRDNISANINRIENDTNFIRAITGLNQYNNTSKVYFNSHKSQTNAILPLYDNRDFLGNSRYTFEISFNNGDYKTIEINSPETKGHQELGIAEPSPNNILPTAGSINVSFNISVNNDSPTFPGDYVNVPVTIEDPTLYDLASIINDSLNSNDVFAEAIVVENESTGLFDVRIYSKSSGDFSKIDVQPGSSDLANNIGTTYETPVSGRSEWPILPSTYSASDDYTATVISGSIVHNDFDADTESVGYQLFMSMYNQGFDDYTVGLSTILSDNHVAELYIKANDSEQGYKELNMSVPLPDKESGLEQLSTYYFQLSTDGSEFKEYSFTTTTDTTYTGIINTINEVISGVAKITIEANNDVRITSDSYGPQSSVDTADGISGTSLFGFGYPAAGFTPVSVHKNSVRGSGDVINVRARRINTFTIFNDLIKKRAIYSHSDEYLYVTPDTETDLRDHIDTEHAFATRSTVGSPESRWSTHNDKVVSLNIANHSSWNSGAYITKLYKAQFDSVDYLLIGNSEGQVFFIDNTYNLYEPTFIADNFVELTDPALSNGEKINNFFIYNETETTTNYLFILTDTHILYTDATAGIDSTLSFTDINANSSLSVPNVSDSVFSEIRDAENWVANVNAATVNRYLIFVGKSEENSTWENAPILYALFDPSSSTFSWYSEEVYKKTQIDDVTSITRYDGWSDPSQTYQVFITNNVNGPEIWAGNTQNNDVDLGSPGNDKFVRFSWIEANVENGFNHLNVDNNLEYFTFLKVFDEKIFVGGIRKTDSVGGLYSYAFNKLENRYKIDSTEAFYSDVDNKLYIATQEGLGANSSPAISVLSQELSEGRVQIFSKESLNTTSNWPSDSAFRIVLTGFTVGGVNFDGEYNVQFDGSGTTTLSDIADEINNGLAVAKDAESGIESDLRSVIKARALTSYVKFGASYNPEYKLVIESKIATDPGAGHTSTFETTQSNCSIEILHPTIGTSVIGTGNDTMEIDPETTGETDLKLYDWPDGKAYQLKRVNTENLSFGGGTFIILDDFISDDYKVLAGSLRVRTNEDDELGFSQGVGKILKTDTSTNLKNDSTNYVLKVTFDEGKSPAGTEEITEVTIPADSSGSLSETYWLLYGPQISSSYSEFYVWYNVDYLSNDPNVTDKFGIEVLISANDSAETVAEKTLVALNELPDFTVTRTSNVITITNNDPGETTDASDYNTGVTINVVQQGSNSGDIVNWINVTGSSVQTINDLVNEINNDLVGGSAVLENVGATSEYCDIKFVSDTVGDDSNVKIERDLYTFNSIDLIGINGLDLIPNKAIDGNTSLNTQGSQTLGFSWRNTDYFLVPTHPDTGETRIYIANGDTRIDPGATVWVDFWEWKQLTKIPAKDEFGANNIPAAGQWTYDIEQKKVVVGEEPSKTYPTDVVYVDANVEKVLRTLDLSDNLPVTQEELSDRFHATLPRNLENSEVSLGRSSAKISALHYGVKLWSTDNVSHNGVLADYSFFLPRIDSFFVRSEDNYFGSRINIEKGTPDANTPYVELSQNNQDYKSFIYSTYINSEDYHNNKIVSSPWVDNKFLEKGKLFLDSDIHYFKPENELISTRGIRPLKKDVELSKVVEDDNYLLVKVTDPLGSWYPRRRNTKINEIDNSQIIFVDAINGNNNNTGYKRELAKRSLQSAIAATTNERPNIIIIGHRDKTVPTFDEIQVNRNFKVNIYAEDIAIVNGIDVIGPLYIEGLKIEGLRSDGITPANVVLINNIDFHARYCNIKSITTSSSIKQYGLKVKVENSIIENEGLIISDDGSNQLILEDKVDVSFNHVYINNSPTILRFNPESYISSVQNDFIFTNVTNSITASNDYVIDCHQSTGINIVINDSLLVTGTETKFASAASVVLNQTLSYVTTNNESYGTGSILSNDSKNVQPGQIDIIPETGTLVSKARGYDENSLAINYVDNKHDAGAFVEERLYNETGANLSNKSLIMLRDDRVQYRADLKPENFSFYIRFKPLGDFQQHGVLFDSRYDGDYNRKDSTFNLNGNDFIQIVYNNNTYGLNYLDYNQYSFKLIISNSSTTNVIVIGPRFTSSNYMEFNNWHEIGVLLKYEKTYNPRYDNIDFNTDFDEQRYQTTIYTTFDNYLDKVYGLKTHQFIGSNGNVLTDSKWRPGSILSNYFNIGGGWISSWVDTPTGKSWSTWTESNFSMILDEFLVSPKDIPLNVIKNFGKLTKIDLYENDYKNGKYDDKNSILLTHCDNSHPFSENGIEPFKDYYVSFRPYEGEEQHALALESSSENIVPYGYIEKGNWFDRSSNTIQFNSASITIHSTASGTEVNSLMVVYDDGTDSKVDLIDYADGSIKNSITLITGDTLNEAVIKTIGNYYILLYTKNSDGKLYYNRIERSTLILSGESLINNAVSGNIDFDRGHSDSKIIVSYHSGGYGYLQLRNIAPDSLLEGPVEFSNGNDVSYNSVSESFDKDNSKSFIVFYRDLSDDALRFVMYSEDVSNIILSHELLVSGELPTSIESMILPNKNILVKWKDYNSSADSPVKFSVLSPDAGVAVSPTTVFATNDYEDKTDDLLFLKDGTILFANKDRSSQKTYFEIYSQSGEELSTSPYLRETLQSISSVFLVYPYNSNNVSLLTNYNSSGTLINLNSDIPTRWYRDYTGIYDEYISSVFNTKTFYGKSLHVLFNHSTSPGETGILVADAETEDLSSFDNNTQTNGTITTSSLASMHGSYGYKFTYNNTGPELFANANFSSAENDLYARFYFRVDQYFSLNDTGDRPIEIAKFGPSSDPLIIELVFNDPATGGDGKFSLRAYNSSYGDEVTPSSVVNYDLEYYLDIRWLNDLSGGWEVWLNDTNLFSQLGQDTTSEGIADFIQIGSESGSTPTSDSTIYYDDLRIDTERIGEYTAGLGQSDIWTNSTISQAGEKHYISGYYYVISGDMILELDGAALNKPISIQLSKSGNYQHLSYDEDSVLDIRTEPINWNNVYRFIVSFVPENNDIINTHVKSINSSNDSRIDEFLVDNIKLEKNEYASSIKADYEGYIGYPIGLKNKGSSFIRIRPQFSYDTDIHHTIFAGSGWSSSGHFYVSHELYYDKDDHKFKFYLSNENGDSITVESDEYGSSTTTRQITDLNESHTIICNWDLNEEVYELIIDNKFYKVESVNIPNFKNSVYTQIGNYEVLGRSADSLFDLIKFSEKPLTHSQINTLKNLIDPFILPNNTNIGNVSVKSLSIFGLHETDEATIYGEHFGETSHLVLSVGNNFEDKVIIKHSGKDLATFGAGGMYVDGVLHAQTLSFVATDTMTTYDDHVTLRYGFTGIPPTYNDGYFEVERGSLTNSEIRWDESQDSWIFSDGTNRYISIDGTHIGTWQSDEDFNLVSNGIGNIRFSTESVTDTGEQNRSDGTERFKITPTESVVNDPGLDYNFRIESLSGSTTRVRESTHLLFTDADEKQVLFGRNSTDVDSGTIVVNYKATMQSDNITQFGIIEFKNNDGDLAGYIGDGNGSDVWQIYSNIKTLSLEGQDLDITLSSTDTDSFSLNTAGGLLFDVDGTDDNVEWDIESTGATSWLVNTEGGVQWYLNGTESGDRYLIDIASSNPVSYRLTTAGGALFDLNGTDLTDKFKVEIANPDSTSFHVDTLGGVEIDVDNGFYVNENSNNSYFQLDDNGIFKVYTENTDASSIEFHTFGGFKKTILGAYDVDVTSGINIAENSGTYLNISTIGEFDLYSVNGVTLEENGGSYFTIDSTSRITSHSNSGSEIVQYSDGRIDINNGGNADGDVTINATGIGSSFDVLVGDGGIELNTTSRFDLYTDSGFELRDDSNSRMRVQNSGNLGLFSTDGITIEESDTGSYLEIDNTGYARLYSVNSITIDEVNGASLTLNGTASMSNSDADMTVSATGFVGINANNGISITETDTGAYFNIINTGLIEMSSPSVVRVNGYFGFNTGTNVNEITDTITGTSNDKLTTEGAIVDWTTTFATDTAIVMAIALGG
jgi:hypothetical protein